MQYTIGNNNGHKFICVDNRYLDEVLCIASNDVTIFANTYKPNDRVVKIESNMSHTIEEFREKISELSEQDYKNAVIDRKVRFWDEEKPWILKGTNGESRFSLIPEQKTMAIALEACDGTIFVMNQSQDIVLEGYKLSRRLICLTTTMSPQETFSYLENISEKEFEILRTPFHTIGKKPESVKSDVKSNIMERFKALHEEHFGSQIDAIIEKIMEDIKKRKPKIGDSCKIYDSFDMKSAKRIAEMVSVRTGNNNVVAKHGLNNHAIVEYYY